MNAHGSRARTLALLTALLAACGDGGGGGGGGGGSQRASSAPPPVVKVEAPAPADDGEPAPAGAPASIAGVVHFEGTPPERKEVTAVKTTTGCCPDEPPRYTEAVIVTDGKLHNVIVSISKGLTAYEPPPVPEESHVMHQKCCVYSPHVSAVRAGQKVLVTNDDKTTHNVHTYSKRTTARNISQPAGAQPLELVFEKPEAPVRVGCDIHPWMKAYVGVFDHPFFAVTGADGAYALEGLPPGKYTVTAWHEEYGKQTAQVELPAGGAARIDFTYRPE